MTITAQLPEPRPLEARDDDRPTDRMPAGQRFVVDTFSVLDHRTRERAIPAAGAPAGRYLAFEQDGEEWLIALQRPITHIGRGLIADIRIEDPQVSRRHAIVAVRGDGARVLDDRSANSTFVNGRPVNIAALTDGDVVRVGRVAFRYVEVVAQRVRRPLPSWTRGRRGSWSRNPAHLANPALPAA